MTAAVGYYVLSPEQDAGCKHCRCNCEYAVLRGADNWGPSTTPQVRDVAGIFAGKAVPAPIPDRKPRPSIGDIWASGRT
jgi:hypothetical protein